MTEKDQVIRDLWEITTELVGLLSFSQSLSKSGSHLRFSENFQDDAPPINGICSSKRVSEILDDVVREVRSETGDKLTSFFGSELTLSLKIHWDFNDHNVEEISGFVLNWTHQRKNKLPDRRGSAPGEI